MSREYWEETQLEDFKELKKMLSEHNDENDVVFYNLENCNLEQYRLESIINADNQTEITTTHEGEE